jgi:RNA polymerase sigma-B factor
MEQTVTAVQEPPVHQQVQLDARPTSRRIEQRGRSRAERGRLTEKLLLEAHAESDLTRRRELLDEVVLINRGVAQAVAARYRQRGVAQDDLEQTAFEGLVKAVRKFDPTMGKDLLTYAVPTIRGEIQRYFRDQSWMVRPPRRVQEMQWQVNHTIDRLSQELGRDPREAEVKEELDASDADYRDAIAAFGCFQPPSLDQPVMDSGLSLGDAIADEDSSDAAAAEARTTLAPAVRRLSERDRRILYLRFFEGRTQQEIGQDLGVTQMQVSRLLARIMRDLRDQIC